MEKGEVNCRSKLSLRAIYLLGYDIYFGWMEPVSAIVTRLNKRTSKKRLTEQETENRGNGRCTKKQERWDGIRNHSL